MKFKVNYTKTVVLTSEFEVEIPDTVPVDEQEEWAQEAAYEMESNKNISWNEIESQGDTPEVVKL